MYELGSIVEEREARRNPDVNFDGFKALVMEMDASRINECHRPIEKFYTEICCLEYRHAGLTATEYLRHPIRIARLALNYSEAANGDLMRLCLAHNVLEVVDQNKCALPKSLLPYSGLLNTLLVDRSREWDAEYKDSYYCNIEKYRLACEVKVIDKLDNLYLLDENKNMALKKKYLSEINQYVIPIAEQYLRKVVEDLKRITKYQESLIK